MLAKLANELLALKTASLSNVARTATIAKQALDAVKAMPSFPEQAYLVEELQYISDKGIPMLDMLRELDGDMAAIHDYKIIIGKIETAIRIGLAVSGITLPYETHKEPTNISRPAFKGNTRPTIAAIPPAEIWVQTRSHMLNGVNGGSYGPFKNAGLMRQVRTLPVASQAAGQHVLKTALDHKTFYHVPAHLVSLYDETVKAYNHGLSSLCAVGVRTIIEGICADQGIRQAWSKNDFSVPDFSSRVEGLYRTGYLTRPHTNILQRTKAGIASRATFLTDYSATELSIFIQITEHLLERVYEMGKGSSGFLPASVS